MYSLMIDEGALPLLESLSFGPSMQLKDVPSGIQYLSKLKELEIRDMSKEFEESLDPKKGLCYWIVKHVPLVVFRRKVGTGFHDYANHFIRSKHLEW